MAKTFDLGNGILSVGTIRKEWTVSVPDLLTANKGCSLPQGRDTRLMTMSRCHFSVNPSSKLVTTDLAAFTLAHSMGSCSISSFPTLSK